VRTQRMTVGPGRMTPMVKKLLMINAAVFVFQLLLPRMGLVTADGALQTFGAYFALVPELVVGSGRVWQLITYQFLHGGLFHILINMFMLWMFGVELERVWNGKAFLRFYLTCGVFAGLSVLVFNYGITPTVGASGAVFGILGAFALYWPNRPLYIWGIVPIKTKYAVMLAGGLELLLGVSRLNTGIGHMAHLGGLFMGLSYVWLSDPRKALLKPLWDWWGKRQARKKQRQWDQRKEKQREMIREVNEILDKLNRMDWEDLSEEEKRKIQRYSDELKDRDDFEDIFNL
jgi:membrane associated rhomboid family serine protease